jgi:hypothetical protein
VLIKSEAQASRILAQGPKPAEDHHIPRNKLHHSCQGGIAAHGSSPDAVAALHVLMKAPLPAASVEREVGIIEMCSCARTYPCGEVLVKFIPWSSSQLPRIRPEEYHK